MGKQVKSLLGVIVVMQLVTVGLFFKFNDSINKQTKSSLAFQRFQSSAQASTNIPAPDPKRGTSQAETLNILLLEIQQIKQQLSHQQNIAVLAPSSEQKFAFNDAQLEVDSILSKGVLEVGDTDVLRKSMQTMTPEQIQQALSQITQAVNSGDLIVDDAAIFSFP